MARERCSYASKYKGIRKPTCGCESCETTWSKKAFDRIGRSVGEFVYFSRDGGKWPGCPELGQITFSGVFHLASEKVIPYAEIVIEDNIEVGRGTRIKTEAEMSERHRKNCLCGDCGKQTFFTDMYMVTAAIWNEHGNKKNVLCIACLEKRVGRALKRKDFVKVPLNTLINQPWAEGTLLGKRLKPTFDMKGLSEVDW